jgi:flagellar biosynthetic protein FliR
MTAIQFLMGSFSQFLMVLLRISGLVIVTPVFSAEMIPTKVKGSIVLMLSLITFPTLKARGLVPDPSSMSEIVMIGAGEVFIGFLIGFMVLLVITLFQVSGQFYSIQMGFGIINVFDPLAEASVPIISQLKTLLMTVLFLLIDGHHYVLRAVMKSYEYLPTARLIDVEYLLWEITTKFDELFKIAFLIGLPLIGVVFLISTTLGILTKLAPQMNVMILGFGLKVLVGLGTFLLLWSEFVRVGASLFHQNFQDLMIIIRTMGTTT